MDARDIRMVERGEKFGLALKASDAIGVCREGVRKDLERDIARETDVGGPIDLAHAPLAEQGHDFISAEAAARGERHGNERNYRRP